MPIPRAFVDELRERVSISDVIGRKVAWDAKKSNPARGDYWACCPFHGEKTPSFHVSESKGFFHCFGCKESGGALEFLMKLENMPFPEAVRTLAADAGMTVPEEDPATAAREVRAKGLAEAMEAAVRWYRAQLGGARADGARRYLAHRGLAPETIDRFEIGYAPRSWEGLSTHLRETGFDEKTIIDAGLAYAPDGDKPGRGLTDRFRDRIMFPIRDPRGRCIAFGGRAMVDGDGPKYLNSPETPLFDKSRVLYNLGPARAAAAPKGGETVGATVIVAEGYMDVIALVQAGFDGAVAPLGTALTNEHLRHLWKMADEPIIALDGDAAGTRAARRSADLALPALAPGKTLRFVTLPDKMDPDDLIRAHGPEAMSRLLDEATTLFDLVWRREVDGARFDTPERTAAFDEKLRDVLRKIEHKDVRRHYGVAFKERRFELLRARRESEQASRQPATTSYGGGRKAGGGRGGDRGRDWGRFARRAPPPSHEAKRRAKLAMTLHGDDADALSTKRIDARRREIALLMMLLDHPGLIERRADRLESTRFFTPELDTFKCAIISAVIDLAEGEITSAGVEQAMSTSFGDGALNGLRREAASGSIQSVGADASIDYVMLCFDELLWLHGRELTWLRETEEFASALLETSAVEDGDDAPPACFERLKLAHKETSVVEAADFEQSSNDEIENSRRLKSFIDDELWIKRPKRAGDA